MRTAFSATALLGLALLLSPAAAEPITELQPFAKDGKQATGTKTGAGEYERVTLGEGSDAATADRLSITMDGNSLTDLTLENVKVPAGADGTRGTIDRIVVENSGIPLDLDEDDPEEIFRWLLNLDADRLALEGVSIIDDDVTIKVGTLAAESIVDGYFSALRISDLEFVGVDDDTGAPFNVVLDRFSVRGFGAGWALYARAAAADQIKASGDTDQPFAGDDFAFLDAFKLADFLNHLRLQGIDMDGLKVSVNGSGLVEIPQFETKTTAFSGAMPAGGTMAMNGTVNIETARSLSGDNPQAQLGMQAFQAMYGGPSVAFSANGETQWIADEQTVRTPDFAIVLDRLMRIGFDMTMTGYDPADGLDALLDPDDDKTMQTAMQDATVTELALRVRDLGALDIGFGLAPPGIDRNQIAAQAAQFAGIGVVQAMQFGISLTGSVAEVVSGFIRDGGMVEVRLQDGATLPWAPLQELLANPEDQAKAMGYLKHLKLEIVGAQ